MRSGGLVLQVADVHKSYGDIPALRGVDLNVSAGEIVGLLGPNGAGKTTLVSIVAGLRRPDRGSVRVRDVDVVHRPQDARPLLGLAPQDTGIYPAVTVRENLVLFGELAGLRRRALAARIDEIGERLGLTQLFGRLGRDLSGGEKRRLHTALALLHRPPMLLLDEPTTGADVQTRGRLLALVRELAAEGSSVLYSTHYLPEVESLGASVAIIDRGVIVARGRLAELVGELGSSTVELTFEGPVPDLGWDGAASVDGSRVRLPSDDPGSTAAGVLARLGPGAARLRSVEIVRPSLESVFLAVTGRRYREQAGSPTEVDEPGGEEATRVTAT